MISEQSCEAKPTKIYWSIFAITSITHYATICAYIFLWTRTNRETSLTTVIFFIGLIAWILQLVQFFYFRKRSPSIARLSITVFISSLLFGLFMTPSTD